MIEGLTKLAETIGDSEHPWAASMAVIVVVVGMVALAAIQLL